MGDKKKGEGKERGRDRTCGFAKPWKAMTLAHNDPSEKQNRTLWIKK